MINVEGDAFGAGIIAHLSKKELADMDNLEPEVTTEGQEHDHRESYNAKSKPTEKGHVVGQNGSINAGFVKENGESCTEL